MSANDNVIVVTGANRGIGFEIARQLARAGARVILTARKPEAGQTAVEKLRKEGLETEFWRLDVTDASTIRELHDFLAGSFGRLDALINNAGIIADGDGSVLTISASVVRQTFETNTLGPLQISQTLIPLLKKSPAGRIINISSGMGSLTEMGGGYTAYRISKAALTNEVCWRGSTRGKPKPKVNPRSFRSWPFTVRASWR